jgi:hypothetical protein
LRCADSAAIKAREGAHPTLPSAANFFDFYALTRSTPHPLLIGLRAARANLWPGLFVQGLMLALVLTYYKAPWTRPWFDWLAELKRRGGFVFSATAAVVAGAILPETLKILFFQRGRANRNNLREFLFAAPFWAMLGLCVDALYRGQNLWFGTDPTFATLVKKVVVDQFIYNPVFAAPVTVWAYEWKNRGFGFHAFGGMFTARFYAEKVMPALIATWGVWIPLVSLIYSLPPLLQTPLFSLALCFWVLLVAYITAGRESPGVELNRAGA